MTQTKDGVGRTAKVCYIGYTTACHGCGRDPFSPRNRYKGSGTRTSTIKDFAPHTTTRFNLATQVTQPLSLRPHIEKCRPEDTIHRDLSSPLLPTSSHTDSAARWCMWNQSPTSKYVPTYVLRALEWTTNCSFLYRKRLRSLKRSTHKSLKMSPATV